MHSTSSVAREIQSKDESKYAKAGLSLVVKADEAGPAMAADLHGSGFAQWSLADYSGFDHGRHDSSAGH